MKQLSRHLQALSVSTSLFLLNPLQALAQTTVNFDPCSQGQLADKGGFGKLCDKSINSVPGVISNVIIILLIAAAILSLLFLVIGGVRWVISGGDKAKLDAARAQIVAAIVGLVITFLAFFILQLVLGFFGLSLTTLRLPTIF